MLKATRELFELLKHSENSFPGAPYIDVLVNFIENHGNTEDLNFLYPLVRTDTRVLKTLYPIVMVHGNADLADELYDKYVYRGKLCKDAPEELLHCLGYMQLEKSKDLLMYYAKNGDYYQSCSACMGLLSFDCSEFQDEIRQEIFSYKGRNLFPELFPALAYKTGDSLLMEFLYELGSTTASTDCNGGLILGIALYGSSATTVFDNVVFNPHWETFGGGTGSQYYLYLGLKIQKFSIEKLYKKFKSILVEENDQKILWNSFLVMSSILNMSLYNPSLYIKGMKDSQIEYSMIYNLVFKNANI